MMNKINELIDLQRQNIVNSKPQSVNQEVASSATQSMESMYNTKRFCPQLETVQTPFKPTKKGKINLSALKLNLEALDLDQTTQSDFVKP